MEEEMRKIMLATVGALGLATAAAAALPAAAQPLPLVKADYWCGAGYHLNAYSECVRNYSYYRHYVRPGITFRFGFRDRDDRYYYDRDRDDYYWNRY